jgi:hypothetical protein
MEVDPNKTVSAQPTTVRIKHHVYHHVPMADFMRALTAKLPHRDPATLDVNAAIDGCVPIRSGNGNYSDDDGDDDDDDGRFIDGRRSSRQSRAGSWRTSACSIASRTSFHPTSSYWLKPATQCTHARKRTMHTLEE